MSLNEQQLKAVHATQGRLLILAGAGSGKTGVIVHRIAHLIENCQVSPQAILGLTFTNKAAAEMRARLQKLTDQELARQVTLSTFHSFCMQVLRREIEKLGYTRDFTLYDERDLERVMQQIARDLLGMNGDLPSLASTRIAIADASNRGLLPKDSFSKDLYLRLQTTLRAYNAVSFDTLIQLTIRLFEEHPDTLLRYQERYQYLMIDEYQDTNPAQFRLAELLSSKHHNLCVVGDDDQSIYGWRGAEVSHILHFKADQVIKLEQNYRSISPILAAANAVIAKNQNRHGKKLWSALQSEEQIEIFNAATEVEEAQSVVLRLLDLKEKAKLRWRDIAILYRSNALSRQLEIALLQASYKQDSQWRRGIPYEIFGGLEFSERSEIKDLLAYLRVIANPRDQEALLRILNVPRRGISDLFLDELTQLNRTCLWQTLLEVASGKKTFPTHSKGVRGICAFIELVETAQKHFAHSLADAMKWFLSTVNYKKAIEEEVKSEKMRLFKWENVQECVNALAQYEAETQDPTLADFIANTTLGKPSFASRSSNEDKVQLMTFHSAKGLEFPAVFLIGLEDHILPHEKSLAQTGLEEERRLFYVGITRAKQFLCLSMARSRMRMGKASPSNPSRFLFDIPQSLLKVTTP